MKLVFDVIVRISHVEYHVSYTYFKEEAEAGHWKFTHTLKHLKMRRQLSKRNREPEAWVDVSDQDTISIPVGNYQMVVFQYYWYEPICVVKRSLLLSSILYSNFKLRLFNYQFINTSSAKQNITCLFIYCTDRYSISSESHQITKIEDSSQNSGLQKYQILRSLYNAEDFDLQYVDLKVTTNSSFEFESSLICEKLKDDTSLIHFENHLSFKLDTKHKIDDIGIPENHQQKVFLLLDANLYCEDFVRGVIRRALGPILFKLALQKVPIIIQCINSSNDRYPYGATEFVNIQLSDIQNVLAWFDGVQASKGSFKQSCQSILNLLKTLKETDKKFIHLMVFSCTSLELDADCKNYTDFLEKPYEMSLNLYNLEKEALLFRTSLLSAENLALNFSFSDSPKQPFRVQTVSTSNELIRLASAHIHCYCSRRHYMITNIRLFGRGEKECRFRDQNWYVMSIDEPLVYTCEFRGELDSFEISFDFHNMRGRFISTMKFDGNIVVQLGNQSCSLPFFEPREALADTIYGNFDSLKDLQTALESYNRTPEIIRHLHDLLDGSHFVKPLQIGDRLYKPMPLWKIHNDLIYRYVFTARTVISDVLSSLEAVYQILPNRINDGHQDWLAALIIEKKSVEDIIDYVKTLPEVPHIENLGQLLLRKVTLDASTVNSICDILWMMNRDKILRAMSDDSLGIDFSTSSTYKQLWDEGYPIEKIHAVVDGVQIAACIKMVDTSKEKIVEKALTNYIAVFNKNAQDTIDIEETIEKHTYQFKLKVNRFQAEKAQTKGLTRDYRQSYQDYRLKIESNDKVLMDFPPAKPNKHMQGENDYTYQKLNIN